MGVVTANISIYIPAAGETNYDASFAAGMLNIDQHDHSGPPTKGVKLSSSGIAPGAITFDKLDPNVADNTTGIGTHTGGLSNQLYLLGILSSIFVGSGSSGFIANQAGTAHFLTLTGTANQIGITNTTGSGNPVFSLAAPVLVPTQPKFSAAQTTNVTNATGDSTAYTVICDGVIFDANSNYSNATGVFTAPVAGKYVFLAQVNMQNIVSTNTACQIRIITTARTYQVNTGNPFVSSDSGTISAEMECIADMNMGETAYMVIQVGPTSKTVTITGTATTLVETSFQGFLLM